MEVTVELRPHVGETQTALGPVKVEHNQYMVVASTPFAAKPIQVGYLGKQPGAPFNGLHSFRKLPDEMKAAIIAELERQRDSAVRSFEPPPPPEESTEPVGE